MVILVSNDTLETAVLRKNTNKAARARPRVRPVESNDSAPQRVRYWTAGKLWILASGWICSIFLGILELPAKIVSFAENKSLATQHAGEWWWEYRRYEGRWTNDRSASSESNLVSSGEAQQDLGTVQLSIVSEGNGTYSGEIVASSIGDGLSPFTRVMLEGTVGMRGFNGEVWDIVMGRKQSLARFRLHPERDSYDVLRLIPDRDPRSAQIFPEEILLWRTDREMGSGEPGRYFQKILDEAARERDRGNQNDTVIE